MDKNYLINLAQQLTLSMKHGIKNLFANQC